MVNKIFKHRMEAPEPLERVARGVPAAFAAIVRKLMAKDPEDRYQSCQELASTWPAGPTRRGSGRSRAPRPSRSGHSARPPPSSRTTTSASWPKETVPVRPSPRCVPSAMPSPPRCPSNAPLPLPAPRQESPGRHGSSSPPLPPPEPAPPERRRGSSRSSSWPSSSGFSPS